MERFVFSNFYEFKPWIKANGLIYKSPEHWYQSCKAVKMSDKQMICNQPTAGKAKQKGNIIEIRHDWNKIKIDIMKRIQEIRFDQPYWEKKLLNYKKLQIIEYNWFHDNFWGACICDRCLYKEKLNHLGKIIQEIRDRKEKA